MQALPKGFALIEKRYHNIFLTPDTYEVIAYSKGGNVTLQIELACLAESLS